MSLSLASTPLLRGTPGGREIPAPRGNDAAAPVRLDPSDLRRRTLIEAKWRARWVGRCFTVIALGALAQVAHLGLSEKASDGVGFDEMLLPQRGEIVDRNGVPLARAFPAYSLWYRPDALGDGPPLVKSPLEVAVALNRIFPDMDVDETAARLASAKPGYLRRRILPEDANRIHMLGEPALEFPREPERYYPQSSLAAHVLGYVDPDGHGGHGRVGMEQVYDQHLLGHAARSTPTPLSIDARVQGALEDELARGMRESAASGATGIIIDVDTGEVLALASLPSFDPNLPARATNALTFNRATNQVYELGSVLKPVTVASAIEAGTVTNMGRRYPSAKPLEIDHFTIHDSHDFGTSLNVPEALIHSSNIVLAQIGDELGGARLNATLRTLGFDQRTRIELPARGFPLWPRGNWSRITTMTVSYGHGIGITPLHLASAYAAMVNGGVWHPATLHKFAAGELPESRRVWKASTSARMRQLLRLIVNIGTGRKADAAGFRVGGKTGTADKNINGHYQHDKVVTTFAAAFPMDHPRYVVLALLDEPHATAATSGQRTAAWNAAPVVGRVVPRIGPLLGVMPDPTHDIDLTDLAPLVASGEGE